LTDSVENASLMKIIYEDVVKVHNDVANTMLHLLSTADDCGVDCLEADKSAALAIHRHLLERMKLGNAEYRHSVKVLKRVLETGDDRTLLQTVIDFCMKKMRKICRK